MARSDTQLASSNAVIAERSPGPCDGSVRARSHHTHTHAEVYLHSNTTAVAHDVLRKSYSTCSTKCVLCQQAKEGQCSAFVYVGWILKPKAITCCLFR